MLSDLQCITSMCSEIEIDKIQCTSFIVYMYSIVLIDCICFYCTAFIISYSAIFAVRMSINVQFSLVFLLTEKYSVYCNNNRKQKTSASYD